LQHLSDTVEGVKKKSIVVSVSPVESASTVIRMDDATSANPIPSRRALVTRFDYATGLTIRTWINLDEEKVVKIRGDLNYPTPLANEELVEAIELLKNSNDEVAKIANEYGDRVQFAHLVPVSSNRSAPRFGHRLVWLWIRAPIHTDKFLVDLSTNEVLETR